MDATLKYAGLAGVALVAVGALVQVLVKMLVFVAGAAFMAGIAMLGVVGLVMYKRRRVYQRGGLRAYEGRADTQRRSADETRDTAAHPQPQTQTTAQQRQGATEYVETARPEALPQYGNR